jgi:hypothetical protein
LDPSPLPFFLFFSVSLGNIEFLPTDQTTLPHLFG